MLNSTEKMIFDELSTRARSSFGNVVSDIDKDVSPTMAMLSQNLVVIGRRLATGDYTKQDADDEIEAQVYAAASVIVRFANEVLTQIQAMLNAILSAAAAVVNRAVGVALL